ncbi:MAG TPA: AraC family transcriptional regulator [Dongiaceae bacterium]|nr:AraC family transcriptional regulator [Dongiaceae bacterium]
MLVPGIPLDAHPAFRASALDVLEHAVAAHLAAKLVQLPARASEIDARANHFKLPNSSLWFCSYGIPLALRFPEPDHIRVQFHHAGIGATWIGSELFPINPRQGCVSMTEAEIDFSPGFEQIVWRIPKDMMVRKLAGIMDCAVTCGLDFDPVLDLASPQGATLSRILDCLLHAADTVSGEAAHVVLSELEQAMITAFLAASNHGCRDLLAKKPSGAAPRQVRRAEDFIEANWNQPLSIEDLAAAAGCSVRSLFRTFRQSRGYTPLEFARRLRLDKARRMLEKPDAATTVTSVAFACGFNDLGRFSKDFTQAFGELPSLVLSRTRGGAACAA